MSSWSESQEVESVHIGDFDAWDVSDGLSQVLSFTSNDEQWSFPELVSPVSEFSSSGSESLGSRDSQNVIVGSESSQDFNGLLGLLNLSDFVPQNKRELWNILDSVSSGHDQSWDGSGGQGGGEGVPSLFDVDLSVPSSPSFERVGHSTLSGLVTESTLA